MWKELTIKEAKEATNKLIEEMSDEECLKIMEEFELDSKKIMEPNRVPSPYGIALKKMIIKYKEMCEYEKELKHIYGENATLKSFIPHAMEKCY